MLTKEEAIEKLKDEGIELNSVVLGRCDGTEWVPIVLRDIREASDFPFQPWWVDGKEWWWIEYICPLAGNESAILTEDDVFEFWDRRRLFL